jgi:hypothetical protein
MLYVTTWNGKLTLEQSSYCLPAGGASSVLTALGDKILSHRGHRTIRFKVV